MNNNYSSRIHTVIHYIEKNITQPMSLDMLADISHFSKYHFSRIFTSMMGVTPIAFVHQKRLQQSIVYLRETDHTILEISSLCGFESISSYNAIFKKHYNRTPSVVRKDLKLNKYSNIPLQSSNMVEEISNPLRYYEGNNSSFLRRVWNMNVEIKELPDYEVAYVRHIGSYLETRGAWSMLGSWAELNRVTPREQFFIGISIDDPGVVEEYACRYDACVTLPEGFNHQQAKHAEISYKRLSGGLYALFPFYDTIDKLAITYQSLFGQWLPNSEYDADDRYCLEFCMNNPLDDPEGKCKIDLYIPIKRGSL
ncbi:AraC family transcriptional regulator [Paenibacillus sp. DS2015]|uniref:AraC family transcriptional regulator n=1 Tax=Paenibacillus sp. DS2015 TaxID=3373917 RepID=UPI003D1AB321